MMQQIMPQRMFRQDLRPPIAIATATTIATATERQNNSTIRKYTQLQAQQ
jgi:hypothetical protein